MTRRPATGRRKSGARQARTAARDDATESTRERGDGRTALLIALVTTLLYGIIAATAFPAAMQFSKYPRAARQALLGTLPAERMLDFSPFYFHLHTARQALVRTEIIPALQILAVGATAALLYCLLLRFFPRWIALAGTVAFVFTRGVMVYAPVLEPEPFLLLFLTAFLHYALGSARGDTVRAGVSLALAVAVRPSVVPLLIVVPLHYVLRADRAHWLRSSAIALAPSLLLLAVLAARNGAYTGTFTPFGMNPGFVFFEGNNPLSSGQSSVYPPVVGELKQEILEHPDNPHLTYRLVARRALDTELSTAAANAYWRAHALRFVRDHPWRWLEVLGKKAQMTFHNHARHDLAVAERFGRRLRDASVPALPFALVSALALVGLVAARREWRSLLPVYAVVFMQLIVLLVFYISERQRLAFVPALIVFAAAGLAWMAGLPRHRRPIAAGGVLLLAAVLMVPTDVVRDERHLWEAYRASDAARTQAFRALGAGRTAEAGELAARAYAAAPWMRDYSRPAGVPLGGADFAERALARLDPSSETPSRQLDRAQLLIDAGRLDEAERVLLALVEDGHRFDRGYTHSSEPRFYLARIASARGQPDQAIEHLQQGLDRTPGDPFILALLAALTGDGRHQARIASYFGEIDAAFLVGLAQFEERTQDHGLANLAETVRRVPEFWRPHIYLAAALGEAGQVDRATALFRRAMATRQEQVMLEARILPIFAAAAETARADVLPRYHYGLLLAQYGRFDEALDVLREAQATEPRPEIAAAIVQIESMVGVQ